LEKFFSKTKIPDNAKSSGIMGLNFKSYNPKDWGRWLKQVRNCLITEPATV